MLFSYPSNEGLLWWWLLSSHPHAQWLLLTKSIHPPIHKTYRLDPTPNTTQRPLPPYIISASTPSETLLSTLHPSVGATSCLYPALSLNSKSAALYPFTLLFKTNEKAHEQSVVVSDTSSTADVLMNAWVNRASMVSWVGCCMREEAEVVKTVEGSHSWGTLMCERSEDDRFRGEMFAGWIARCWGCVS